MLRSIRQRHRNAQQQHVSGPKSSPILPQIVSQSPNRGSTSTSTSTSLEIRSWKRRKRYILPVILSSLAMFQYGVFPLLFGDHPLSGGYLGLFLDVQMKKHIWNQKLKEARIELRDWGLEGSEADSKSKASSTTVPHAVLLEILHQNEKKKHLMEQLKLRVPSERRPRSKEEKENASRNRNRMQTTVIALRPQGIWNRPVLTEGLEVVDFTESDMEFHVATFAKMEEGDGDSSSSVQAFHRLQGRAKHEFFFLLFLSHNGGVYMDPFCNHEDHKEVMEWMDRLRLDKDEGAKGSDGGLERGWVRIQDGILQNLIVPPHHRFLTCIQDAVVNTEEVLETREHANLSFHAIVNEIGSKTPHWDGNTKGFVMLPHDCATNSPLNFGSKDDVSFARSNPYGTIPVMDISVSISTKHEPSPEYTKKITMDQKLKEKASLFCHNVWLWPCHRCLKSAMYGSYAKCSFLCGSCLDLMYAKDEHTVATDDTDTIVHVNVDVSGYRVDGKSQMIPRVIHQTWFEDITPLRYPNLNRLLNSWRTSGWTYKFYTDENARQYILDHFPNHFLQAYDALIPGAYKADLFRYMVLMREGGIYADIDVLLEATLDTFITPTMSFFSPRDAVADYADGQYCLWNGLIGAAPGHPILVRAVERLVNLILNRADILDLENDVAQKVGIDTETWKVRAVQELVLSGPCGLGIAANEMLGNDPTARFGVGWVNSTESLGDLMILMQDKDDLSAMRFTDIERNIIFASTDMRGVNKDRLDRNSAKKKRSHYRETGRGFGLWGSDGVYKNDLVSKRKIECTMIP